MLPQENPMSITILLADERQVMLQNLRALLEKEPGVTVVAEARDRRTLIRLTRELAPQVVVLEVTMPARPGINATREILAESPGVKVMAVSVHSDRRLALHLLKAGASAYLLKDRLCEELVPALHTVMAHKIHLSPGISDLVLTDYLEALRDREARWRAGFDLAPFGVAWTDLEGRLLETNPALQGMLGYSRDELHHLSLPQLAHPDDAGPCLSLFQELARGGPAFDQDSRYLCKDGRQVWGRLHVARVRSWPGPSGFAIAFVENITERKQAEEEIRAYQGQLRALVSEISWREARDRSCLATDLHDHIGQTLAVAQIRLGEFQEGAAAAAMTGSLGEVRQLVDQAIKSSRALIFELSPPVLYDLGLAAAVEWFGDYLKEHHGLQVAVQPDDPYQPLNIKTRVLLFQMVRELMLNAARHARARRAEVSIRRQGDLLLIQVTDDGVGFDPEALAASREKPRGWGLFSLRELVAGLGGTLRMDSRPGRGTQASLMVPVWQDSQPEAGAGLPLPENSSVNPTSG
jgi:PAS domain S-box-containing protein